MFTSDIDFLCSFLTHEVSSPEFEKWLYTDPHLNSKFGEELFMDILSLNYKDRDVRHHLEKIVFDQVLTRADFESWKFRKKLNQYGWFKGRQIKVPPPALDSSEAMKNAINIISEYGGLQIGNTGSERHSVVNDIEFFTKPIEDEVPMRIPKHGNLVCFATAHRQHIGMYVDNKGRYYVFADPNAQLYQYKNDSFEAFLSDILYGSVWDNSLKIDFY